MLFALLLFAYFISVQTNISALPIATAKNYIDGNIISQESDYPVNVEIPSRQMRYIIRHYHRHGSHFHSRFGHFYKPRHHIRFHSDRVYHKIRLEHQYRKIKGYRNSIAKYLAKIRRNSYIIHRLRRNISTDAKHVASYRKRIPYLFAKIRILKRTINEYRQRIKHYNNRLRTKHLLKGTKSKNKHKTAKVGKTLKSNSAKSEKAGKLQNGKTAKKKSGNKGKSDVKAGKSHGTHKLLHKKTQKTTKPKSKSLNAKKLTVLSKNKHKHAMDKTAKKGKSQAKPKQNAKKKLKGKAKNGKKLSKTVGKNLKNHMQKKLHKWTYKKA